MKLTLSPAATSSGRKVVIGDDENGDVIEGLLPDEMRDAQENKTIDGLAAEYFGRENRSTSFDYRVTREHRDFAEAVVFKLDHAGDVPVEGLLEFEIIGGGGARFQNVCVTRVKCVHHTGCKTIFDYAMLGGPISKKNPNT